MSSRQLKSHPWGAFTADGRIANLLKLSQNVQGPTLRILAADVGGRAGRTYRGLTAARRNRVNP